MDIGLTKMSSKGQIVIPADMRDEIEVGEKLIVIKNKGQLILKKATELSEQFLDDLEFARQTEEAYKAYERGEFKSMDADEFLKELEKW
ncbi:MAG: hypothetical protein MAG795_00794 [Candidatus Woesearchaeota archaeon]|nr:hypothetical protein [Candidatus Woesearchaeota archaeon]